MIKHLFYFLVLILLTSSCESPKEEKMNYGEKIDHTATNSFKEIQLTHMFQVPMPDSLFFAGERVPLKDFDVRERLERELISNTFRHTSTILLLKRANRWRPVLEETLNENGVPKDFFYAAVAESDLMNRAISPAGALGMWQFMKETGKEYGLKINDYVDERKHPILATKAAALYYKKAKSKFGNWTMAAASYNMGMRGLSTVAEKQNENIYYDLFLNTETSRYVFRLLAFKVILENPNAYGFKLDADDLYKPFEYIEYEVKEDIENLADFAKKHGTTYKILRVLNPWLDDNSSYKLKLSGDEQYILFLPVDSTKPK